MRSWLRNALPCRRAGFLGSLAFLLLCAALMVGLPGQAAAQHDCEGLCNPKDLQEIDELLDARYDLERAWEEEVESCMDDDPNTQTQEDEANMDAPEEPKTGKAGGCNNSFNNPPGIDAMNQGNGRIRPAILKGPFQTGPGAMPIQFQTGPGATPIQYFVEQAPHAVMACAVQYNGVQTPAPGALKQNAVYHPEENSGANPDHSSLPTPVAFFNRLDPPKNSTSDILRQLAVLKKENCDNVKGVGVCPETTQAGKEETERALNAIDDYDKGQMTELQGSSSLMAMEENSMDLKQNAGLTLTAGGGAAKPKGVVRRVAKSGGKTPDIGKKNARPGQDSKSQKCTEEGKKKGACSS